MKREWQFSVATSILCHGLLLVALQQAWKQLQIKPAAHEETIRVAVEWVSAKPGFAESIQSAPLIAAEPLVPRKPEMTQSTETAQPPAPTAIAATPAIAETPIENPAEPAIQRLKPQEIPIETAAAETQSPPPRPIVLPAASSMGAPIPAGRSANSSESRQAQFTAPTYLSNPQPAYPAAARRRRQEGSVLLRVEVTADGHAARVRTSQSSGYPILDQAAVQAVSIWVFEPARLDAKPVPAEIEVPIHFRIGNADSQN